MPSGLAMEKEGTGRKDGRLRSRTKGNKRWYGSRGRWLILAAVLALLLSACAGGSANGSATGSTTSSTNSEKASVDSPASKPAAEDLAYDFSFTLYQGADELGAGSLTMADLRGKPVVLNFWAGLCPPCRAEMPDLQEFHDEFKEKVTLIGVDVGQFTGLGDRESAKALLTELGISYPAGYTGDGGVMQGYKVLGMPTTVFLNSKGEVFRKWGGVLNRDTLVEITNDMLAKESGS